MKHLLFQILLLAAPLAAIGAETEPSLSEKELPRFAPLAPDAALGSFQVKKGFHLELVASEPNVMSPVAISFDEDGRMYVVEMVDYSERRDQVPHLGQIRVLEDLDDDGVYEKSTVFATTAACLSPPPRIFCS
jgi:hypothetical protein